MKGWSTSGKWVDYTHKCPGCGTWLPLPGNAGKKCPKCGTTQPDNRHPDDQRPEPAARVIISSLPDAIRRAFVLAVLRYSENSLCPKEEDVVVGEGPCRYDCFWSDEGRVSVVGFAYPKKDSVFIYIAVVKNGNVTRYPCTGRDIKTDGDC